jgi:hypothetical protein
MSDEERCLVFWRRCTCDFEVCGVLPVMRLIIQRSELRRWRDNFRLLSDGKRRRCEVVLECGRLVVCCAVRAAFRMAPGISQSAVGVLGSP